MENQIQSGGHVAMHDLLCSSVPKSTAWAKAHPEIHRERCREAMRKYRQTPKGKAAGQAYEEKRKSKRPRPDEVACIKCGITQPRMETKLQGWIMSRKWGKCKGVCNFCA
jgi:hypothetical protein